MTVVHETVQHLDRETELERQLGDVRLANAVLTTNLLKAREEVRRIEQEARRDSLIPELLGKKAITELIEERISQAKPFGLFLVDLNNFKVFNDTYGHRRGDEMLREVGVTLANGFRRQTDALGTSAGRIGGDEFITLIDLDDGGHSRASSYQDQMDNTYEFIEGLEKQFLSENQSAAAVNVGFAIGGTYYNPKNPIGIETMLDQADEAMYEEKGGAR